MIVCCAFIHSRIPGFWDLGIVYLCFQFLGIPFEFLIYYGAKFRNRWFLGLWLFIGYMDFMGAVLIGIMSFFSTRSILFDISFFFRSISRINSGAKVIGGAIWFNLQWWMYMVVWAAFLDIGREDEETERVRYNALLDEEDEANEALAHKEVLSLIKENENDSAYASKVASATSERSSRSTKKSGLDGIEYVPAIAAGGLAGAGIGLLAENALNRSQGSTLSSNMDKEDALSVHTVNLFEESGGYPSEPPPAYSYEEPESDKPMSAGIPFQTDLPGGESRGSSATSVPAISRLGSANQDLISGSQYGSRAGSAESGFGSALPPVSQHGSRGPSATSARSELESRAGSAISAKSEVISRVASAGSRVSSAGSVFHPSAEGSRLGSAVGSRPASTVSGSPVPVTSTTPTGQGATITSESPAPLPIFGYQNSGFIEDELDRF